MGPSYTLISPKAEIERSVNLVRQRIETDQGAGRFVMMKSPGQTAIFQPTGGNGQYRGNGLELNNQVTLAIDNKVLVLDAKNHVKSTYIATINNDLAPVRFASSGTSVMLVSYNTLYRGDGTTLTPITTLPFIPIDIVYIESYYVAISNGTQFGWSTDDGVTWNAANIEIAQANANNFVGAIVHQDILFLYGNRVTLPYAVGSNAFAPFVAQSSGVIPYGLETIGTLQSIGNFRYWLGRAKEGQYVVYQGQGYQTQRISNFALENQIRTYAKRFGVSDAFAMVYRLNGQEFYRITFPQANATWELNSTLTQVTGTPDWSEIGSRPLGQAAFSRHRANMMISAFGTILTGDYQNGWLHELSPDEYTDFGYPLPFLRRSPHLIANGLKIGYDQLRLHLETGVGLDPPLWLNSYAMNRATFVSTLATQVGLGNVTAAQSTVLQNIYDLVPYTPLNPYPSPDTMNTLGFVPWGGYATLTGGTVLGGPPSIGLQYSNDGGRTFGPALYRSLGMEGDNPQVHWDRLGTSRNRVFQLSGDCPSQLAITQAYLDSEVLQS